jgi:hypothetical protein
MWLLYRKKKLSFNSNQEFYVHVDSLIERLKGLHLIAPARELHAILHEGAWTTSSELLGELRLALVKIRAEHGCQLPSDVKQDVVACIRIINDVWNRANLTRG